MIAKELNKRLTKIIIMKREILFRRAHFDVDNKFMYFTYWGFLNHKDEFDSKCFKSPSNSNKSRSHIDEQFTGLTDKNGVKIFENDILDNNEIVTYSNGCFMTSIGALALSVNHREIIGNIHA